MVYKLIFQSLYLILLASFIDTNGVEVLYKWKVVEFENLPQAENSTIGPHAYYSRQHNNIQQFGYHPLSGLMIVTVTRTRPGVPITLGAFCVQDYEYQTSPKIWAFPNNEANLLKTSDFTGIMGRLPILSNILGKEKESQRIISTYTVNIDEKCNRAFTIDTGVISFFGLIPLVIQKPAILVYDLSASGCVDRNFKLIRRVEFPDSFASILPAGILYMTIDFQSDNCDDIFIYITNVYANYLAVFDYKNSDFWIFKDHPSFLPDITQSFITDGDMIGVPISLGVVSVALGYPDENGDRQAYYMPSTGTEVFVVSTKILKDKSKAKDKNFHNDVKLLGYRGKNSQVSKTAVDYTHGVIFFLEYQANRIRCWNMRKPFVESNLGVSYQSPTPLYGMMIFIDSQGYMWFSKSRTGKIVGSNLHLSPNEENSVIYRIRVEDAIKGTVCENYTNEINKLI